MIDTKNSNESKTQAQVSLFDTWKYAKEDYDSKTISFITSVRLGHMFPMINGF